jgi:prepilin-type N-terminal cleavage/methylation domain-containing protein
MSKKGFSLIELMIVIVIIGVVYSLALSKLHTPKTELQTPSFKNLKGYLASFSRDNKSVQLLCKKSCSKCAIYSNGEKIKEIKSFFDASVEFYRYDFFLGDVALQKENCFDFSVDADGVSDQIIILYKEKVYDYTPYFKDVEEYNSLEELNDAKEKLIGAVYDF